MDDQTLQALLAAYRLSPGNTPLLALLLDAHLKRGEAAQGAALLEGGVLSSWVGTPAERPAAELLLRTDQPRRCLELLADDAPWAQLLRARAHLALDQLDAARQCYRDAISRAPALEDPDLERQLGATRQVQAGPSGRALRILRPEEAEAPPAVHTPERFTFDDVGGLEEVKKQIHRRVILPAKEPGLLARFRRRSGGGLLLYGPPGCGKTLIAKATAGQMGAHFISVGITDVLDMYIGESEQKLRALFELARQKRPSVLFFDEVEALGGRRRAHEQTASSNLVSHFLSELDGVGAHNEGVLVLGATNLPWAVDAAFRRPGRFDRMLFIPPPDKEARRCILQIHLKDRPLGPDVDVDHLVKHTSGFSGADLRNIVETAVDEAIEASLTTGQEQPLSQVHLRAALQQVKSTTQEWLTTARNYARYANEGGQYDDVLAFLQQHGR